MRGKQLIQTIRLQNFLSYGSRDEFVQLKPLNVLIGPNASGKSNFIEAVSLLQRLPVSGGLSAAVRVGGGINEYLWKGSEGDPIAEIDVTVPYSAEDVPLRYKLRFTSVGQRLEVVDEVVENESPLPGYSDVYFYYRHQSGHPVFIIKNKSGEIERRFLKREDLNPEESVLSQRKDPDTYPEVTYLGDEFSQVQIYGAMVFRPSFPPRAPVHAGAPENFLSQSGENLALVLNNLKRKSSTRTTLIEKLRRFYDGFDGFEIVIQGNTVQLYVNEKGLQESIPANHLSDGTLRYLCLLAILCHPNPPPLICIEEPELGLHPDALPAVAELLIDASQRTQLIVTTHSDILVSALYEVPEAILVCERDEGGTHLRRLDPNRLKKWLEEYSLGELWLKGEIGGTRW